MRKYVRCPRCGGYSMKATEAEALAECPERDYAAEDAEAKERAGLTNIEGSPSGLQIGTVKEALKGWSDWLGDLEPVLADEPWLDDPIARGFCPRCGTPTDIHGDECPDWAGSTASKGASDGVR